MSATASNIFAQIEELEEARLAAEYEQHKLRTEIYLLRQQLEKANQQIDEMISAQRSATDAAEKFAAQVQRDKASQKAVEAELRELRKLDPRRLAKVNKEQKKKIAELKESLKSSEAKRREALKQHNLMLKKTQAKGITYLHVDPKTGNSMRFLQDLRVSKTNEFGGVPGTPVIEYFHRDSGCSRQAVLCMDGRIGWANIKPLEECMPTTEESQIAKTEVIKFCKQFGIKIPKEVEHEAE